MPFERITVDPARMGGLPTIRDTRVTVGMVLGQLAVGRTIEEVLSDYPYLERVDVLAALESPPPGERAQGARRQASVKLLVDANLSPRVGAGLRAMASLTTTCPMPSSTARPCPPPAYRRLLDP